MDEKNEIKKNLSILYNFKYSMQRMINSIISLNHHLIVTILELVVINILKIVHKLVFIHHNMNTNYLTLEQTNHYLNLRTKLLSIVIIIHSIYIYKLF